MWCQRLLLICLVAIFGTLGTLPKACATGVPIGGFLPLVGLGLTDEFDDDFNFNTFPSSSPSGTMLGAGGAANYDLALLDTGAAVSIITAQAATEFNIPGPYPGESDGFSGTEFITIGGATGFLEAEIFDPLGLYATGLQNRTGTSPLALNNSALRGQTNTSIIGAPAESDLPNVLGLPFASQYATYIRSDLPQIFSHDGKTVRTPHVEFLPLGSGGQGITRRAPLTLSPGASFAQPPSYLLNIGNFDIDHPNENPSLPTLVQGGLFLSVDVENEGEQLHNFNFFFDTGADVTVVSELNASRLGFDPILDEPDFTVAVVGSGGVNLEVPGFFVEEFTIQAVGGNVTAFNVPVIVLNVPNPADSGNIVDGIVGTNLLAGRNVVVDPDPALGGGNLGPHLYISDPITSDFNWANTGASGPWTSGGNWSAATAPNNLGIANVRYVAGGDQTAVLSADTTVWELNVSGTSGQTMTVQIDSGQTLTTFAGVNIEAGGAVHLVGSTIDTQYVEILGGSLSGAGLIKTGSGPIPGQVENREGTVSPGNGVGSLEIEGRFSNGVDGTLAIEIGGLVADTMFDQLIVHGPAALGGTLDVSLVDLGSGMFAPQFGDAFETLTATEGIGGTFDTLLLPVLPDDMEWFVRYNTNSLELAVTVQGDFDGDFDVDAEDLTLWQNGFGEYTGNDFLAWQRNFGWSAFPGDFDDDFDVDTNDLTVWQNGFGEAGGYTGSDFLAWQRNFEGSVPATAQAGAVPEPSTLVFCLVGLAMGLFQQRRTT